MNHDILGVADAPAARMMTDLSEFCGSRLPFTADDMDALIGGFETDFGRYRGRTWNWSGPERAEAEVLIPSPRRTQRKPADPTGSKAINRLIGRGKVIAPDAAANYDKCLYDDPGA